MWALDSVPRYGDRRSFPQRGSRREGCPHARDTAQDPARRRRAGHRRGRSRRAARDRPRRCTAARGRRHVLSSASCPPGADGGSSWSTRWPTPTSSSTCRAQPPAAEGDGAVHPPVLLPARRTATRSWPSRRELARVVGCTRGPRLGDHGRAGGHRAPSTGARKAAASGTSSTRCSARTSPAPSATGPRPRRRRCGWSEPDRPLMPAAAVAGLAGKLAGFRHGLLVSTALTTVAAWSSRASPELGTGAGRAAAAQAAAGRADRAATELTEPWLSRRISRASG